VAVEPIKHPYCTQNNNNNKTLRRQYLLYKNTLWRKINLKIEHIVIYKNPFFIGDVKSQIFGGIDVNPFDSEPKPVAKTFFGQNPIPDISELGLRLDNADTLAKQVNPVSVAATFSTDGERGFNPVELVSETVTERYVFRNIFGVRWATHLSFA